MSRLKGTQPWSKEHPRKDKKLRDKYGITFAQYQTALKEQHNMCAICPASFSVTKPMVDHDHATGRFRGILCQSCNQIVGVMERNEAAAKIARLLFSALNYISRLEECRAYLAKAPAS
jgi:hypothetical protein